MPSTLSAGWSDVSRHSEISIQCYLHIEEPKCSGNRIADNMGNDILMGSVWFMLDFDNLMGQDQWYDLAGGSGRIQIGVAFKPSTVSTRGARGIRGLRWGADAAAGPIAYHRRL